MTAPDWLPSDHQFNLWLRTVTYDQARLDHAAHATPVEVRLIGTEQGDNG